MIGYISMKKVDMVTLNKLTDIQITSCDNHQFSVYSVQLVFIYKAQSNTVGVGLGHGAA